MSSASHHEVLVIGAGAAGLAAAEALAREGVPTTVLEQRPYVGGRAYSYAHPALEEVVDSQHVLLGCCTNLLDFCERTDIAGQVRWYDRQTFLEPAGFAGRAQPRASEIVPSLLPAPLQYTGSFLRAHMLSAADKIAVARGLGTLCHGKPESDAENVSAWYRRTQQTPTAIRNFWEPIVLATLNDSAENTSMRYAGKVFYEIFLKNRGGGRLGIPTVPLSEFYGDAAEQIRSNGVALELRARVDELRQLADGRWLARAGERTWTACSVILALPFEQTQRLFSGLTLERPAEAAIRDELLAVMDRFVHSPFLSILLWYDRQITDLDHAWLLETSIQWFFHKSRIRGYEPERGSYVELVIAGSRSELPRSRAEILEPALAELARFFPAVRNARLLKSGILKEARATFTAVPGLEVLRSPQACGIPGLFLAGDWTCTGWPSTMEGAVRSGRLAAGALLGEPLRFLSPELPVSGFSRLL